MNEHFDLGEAAAFLHVSCDEVLELIQRGVLPAKRQRHGGWTIPHQAVMEYHKQKGQSHDHD